MKNIIKIEKEFIENNHWLICDCDLGEKTDCKMGRILPAFRKSMKKIEKLIIKEFINGERCLSCGCKKEVNNSNICFKCEELEFNK